MKCVQIWLFWCFIYLFSSLQAQVHVHVWNKMVLWNVFSSRIYRAKELVLQKCVMHKLVDLYQYGCKEPFRNLVLAKKIIVFGNTKILQVFLGSTDHFRSLFVIKHWRDPRQRFLRNREVYDHQTRQSGDFGPSFAKACCSKNETLKSWNGEEGAYWRGLW